MKIAFISTILHYPWGGADHLWTASAGAALDDGHHVLLAVAGQTATHAKVRRLVERGARLHIRKEFTQFNGRKVRWRHRVQRWLGSSGSLTATLDTFGPDFVFINQGGTFDFLIENGLEDWLIQARRPYAIICHSNSESDALSARDQAHAISFLQRAHRIAFVSTHNLTLAERQIGANLPRALVVQNPIELPFAVPLPWPDEREFRLAVVARIEARPKGLDVLVDAVALALGNRPGWRLDFFGRGPDEAMLRARAGAAGLADRVQFCGFASDLRSIWNDHHLLLLPSRREGCPIAMIEALLCGRPVLATVVGGVSDWLTHGINGYVCPECATEPLAATLREAWDNRGRWHLLGAAAQEAGRRLDPAPARTLLALVA